MTSSVEPCVDSGCPVHARGADPARASALTCARQVLRAHDRADAIVLLEQEPPSYCDVGAVRVVLPLRFPPLSAGQSEQVMAEPVSPRETPPWATRLARRIHSFRPERVLLKVDGPTQRLGSSWRVDDVLVNGKSQLGTHGRLPAELFCNHVAGAGVRVFDRAADPVRVEVCVTRLTGEGQDALVGAVLGSATYEPRAVPLRSETRVRAGEIDRVSRVCEQPVELYQLVIPEGDADWVVSDIRIEDVSQFSQAGDVPGEMFAEGMVDSFMQFGTVGAGERVEVVVTYVGADPEGAVFSAELRGQEPEVRLISLHSDRVLPGTTMEVERVAEEPLQVGRLVVEGGADWAIHDVRIDDVSRLSRPGDLPGNLLAEDASTTVLRLGLIAAGSRVQLVVTYVGADPEGRALSAQIRGLAPRSLTQRG